MGVCTRLIQRAKAARDTAQNRPHCWFGNLFAAYRFLKIGRKIISLVGIPTNARGNRQNS